MEYPYLIDAIDAALLAGEEIMGIYDNPQSDFGIEHKADNSPLTMADKKAHAIIAHRLASTPYPLLSEEGKLLPYTERQKWTDLWIVDPLDGTKEFIKRNGEFTVNIALIHQDAPAMGIIYVPVKHVLYFAAQDLGAFRKDDIVSLNGQTLEDLLRTATRLPDTDKRHNNLIVVASRSHLTTETQTYINDLKEQYNDVVLASSGSSLKICMVAEGMADVYPRFAPTMEWDTAAGHAIVRATGGEIWQAQENVPLRYNKENLLNPWFIVLPADTGKNSFIKKTLTP